MSETNYFRLIEAYFEGNISPSEKAMLDAKINSDPLVKAEFDLQHTIVEGISNARKLELKSRLASIELPSNTALVGGSATKWLAGTIVGVTLIGSVLYWSLSSFDPSIKPLDIRIDHEVNFGNEFKKYAHFPKAKSETVELAEENQKEPINSLQSIGEEKAITATDTESTPLIAKVQPQALMSFEDDEIFANQTEEVLENPTSKEIAYNRIDKTEIEFLKPLNKNEEEVFHYRYYNSKLYLYGDFNDMPYQIIELNDKGQKQLFISYNEDVYVIKDNTSEITELRKLDDKMLKMEIQLIVNE